jgi:hypothetical protein
MSWPQAACAPPPSAPVNLRARLAGLFGALLITSGVVAAGVAAVTQVHAPQPAPVAAGALGPSGRRAHGPSLRRSLPVSVDIPAIGVHSLSTRAGEAAWYKYSAAPGQPGTAVIEGHVDSYRGPAVFFRLGALHPGDSIDVRLADGITAVFRVTGVRKYAKSRFPAREVYRAPGYAALRLITCGGTFDYATRSYLSSVVVFASLRSSRPAAS